LEETNIKISQLKPNSKMMQMMEKIIISEKEPKVLCENHKVEI
jgi:hypothetical protein